ncbi:MAG: hypothetical protein ISS57_07320 [Anaerolineales bacterium]|nr:hypothetical protein [Anaerolineales bacterium]
MNELEVLQPEENLEGGDTGEVVESAEEETLQDATLDPGTRIEETQDYAQSEAVEDALTEAMDNTVQRQDDSTLPAAELSPAPETPGGDEYIDETGILLAEDDGEERGGVLPVPIPEPTDIEGGEELGTLPIPIPRPALEDESTGALTPSEGSGREQIEALPVPVFNPALEDDGGGQVDHDPPEQLAKDHPGTGGYVAEAPEPGPHPFPQPAATDDPPEPERPNIERRLEGGSEQVAQEPDPVPDTGLSPGFDGHVAEDPEPGGTPPMPDNVAIDPDPLLNTPEGVGQKPSPDPDPPGSHGLSPGFDGQVAQTPEPAPDPPGLDAERHSEEGGKDDGGEATPINIP